MAEQSSPLVQRTQPQPGSVQRPARKNRPEKMLLVFIDDATDVNKSVRQKILELPGARVSSPVQIGVPYSVISEIFDIEGIHEAEFKEPFSIVDPDRDNLAQAFATIDDLMGEFFGTTPGGDVVETQSAVSTDPSEPPVTGSVVVADEKIEMTHFEPDAEIMARASHDDVGDMETTEPTESLVDNDDASQEKDSDPVTHDANTEEDIESPQIEDETPVNDEPAVEQATPDEIRRHLLEYVGTYEDQVPIRAIRWPISENTGVGMRFFTPHHHKFFELDPEQYEEFNSLHEAYIAGFIPYGGPRVHRIVASEDGPKAGLVHYSYGGETDIQTAYDAYCESIGVEPHSYVDPKHPVEIQTPVEPEVNDTEEVTANTTHEESVSEEKPAPVTQKVEQKSSPAPSPEKPAPVMVQKANTFSAAKYAIDFIYRDGLDDRPEVTALLDEKPDVQLEKLVPNQADFDDLTDISLGVDVTDVAGFISRQSYNSQSMVFQMLLMNKSSDLDGLREYSVDREMVKKFIAEGKVPALTQYQEALTSARDVSSRGRDILRDKLTLYCEDFEAHMNQKIREAEQEYLAANPPMTEEDYTTFKQKIDDMIDQQLGYAQNFFNAARKQILNAILDADRSRPMRALREVVIARNNAKNDILGAIEAEKQFNQMLLEGKASQDELERITASIYASSQGNGQATLDEGPVVDPREYKDVADRMDYDTITGASDDAEQAEGVAPDETEVFGVDDSSSLVHEESSDEAIVPVAEPDDLDVRLANLVESSDDEDSSDDEEQYQEAGVLSALDEDDEEPVKKKKSRFGIPFGKKRKVQQDDDAVLDETVNMDVMMSGDVDSSEEISDGPGTVRHNVAESAGSNKMMSKSIKTDGAEGETKKRWGKAKIALVSGAGIATLLLGGLGVVALTGDDSSGSADASASASMSAQVEHLQAQFPIGSFYSVNINGSLVNVEVKAHTPDGVIVVDSAGNEHSMSNAILAQYINDNPDAFPSYDPSSVAVDSASPSADASTGSN